MAVTAETLHKVQRNLTIVFTGMYGRALVATLCFPLPIYCFLLLCHLCQCFALCTDMATHEAALIVSLQHSLHLVMLLCRHTYNSKIFTEAVPWLP